MAYTTQELVGVGMYSVAEAAMYANVPAAAMRRWLWSNRQGRSALKAELRHDDDEKFVTFLDFVQSLTIRRLRLRADERLPIPLDKIRQTIEIADKEHGIQYPFARRHTVYSLGTEIILDVEGVGKIQTSGKNRRQHVAEKIVELHLTEIGYDGGGLAANFTAWRDGDLKIVMNPKLRFGEPYLENRGITAYSLWNAVQAEGGVEEAARAYEIEPREVKFAAKYYESIRRATAA